MFEQAFKNIDDILHKDSGASSELDYVEQSSWILFLKYLDDLEKDKQTEVDTIYEDVYSRVLGQELEEIALKEQLLDEYIRRQEGGNLTRKNNIKMSFQTRKIVK